MHLIYLLCLKMFNFYM